MNQVCDTRRTNALALSRQRAGASSPAVRGINDDSFRNEAILVSDVKSHHNDIYDELALKSQYEPLFLNDRHLPEIGSVAQYTSLLRVPFPIRFYCHRLSGGASRDMWWVWKVEDDEGPKQLESEKVVAMLKESVPKFQTRAERNKIRRQLEAMVAPTTKAQRKHHELWLYKMCIGDATMPTGGVSSSMVAKYQAVVDL